MRKILTSLSIFAAALAPLMPLAAETVIVSTVPDETRSIEPLASFGGIPLDETARIRVGAFPGLDDDALLDLASSDGLAGVDDAFAPFGDAAFIGQGVQGEAGGFEISARDTGAEALDGETIGILIDTEEGEFLIARFEGVHFEAQTATGLEPLHALHLADARLVAGSRIGAARISTAPAPQVGSFASWIAGFPALVDPDRLLPGADPDRDGRSNFLEYATGGNPAAHGDLPACEILSDGEGGMWVRFRRVPGLGAVRYTPFSSPDLAGPWVDLSLAVEPDPNDPAILRVRRPAPLDDTEFFRLLVAPE